MRISAMCTAILAALVLCGSASAASMFYIQGAGNGHGVGMSQYGAYGYALHGKDYRFILAHYYSGTAIGTTDPSRVVRVLLSDGPAAFAGATRAGKKKLDPSLTYTLRALADGSLILSQSSGKKVGRFPAPLVVTGPGPLSVAGLGAYRGALEFRPDGHGGVQTVDALGVDDYVRGVISAEMPATWSPEALKVQAVAARTYAITSAPVGAGFDLYRDTRSQMYLGIAAETPATDAAVAATRGQIVTYAGAPVVTYFSASSGGQTEDVENVWPRATPEPWLRGVPDPYDGAAGNPYYRWSYRMATAAAAAKLKSLVKGKLVGIEVLMRGASPRIRLANVVGSEGTTTVTGAELQRRLGLLTTYASFTTISAQAGGPAGASAIRHAPHESDAVTALVSLVHQLVAGVMPSLQGQVVPARQGDTVAVQEKRGGAWPTVGTVRLGTGGTYQLQLPEKGTYRVVYSGLDGPVVSVP